MRDGLPEWSAAVVGAVLSAVLSVGLLSAAQIDAVQSLVVGLVGVSIGLLIEVLLRLEILARGTAALNAAGPYGARLREIARLINEINRAVPPAWVSRELDRQFDTLARDLTELAAGKLTTRDHRHLIRAVSEAHTQVLAVTNTLTDLPGEMWWTTALGKQYWAENVAALERGVRIRRIFVYDTLDPALRLLLDQQKAAGVEVRVVHGDALERTLHRNLAVIDTAIAWEGRTNARGVQDENVMSHHRTEVERLTNVYGRCAVAAESYPLQPDGGN